MMRIFAMILLLMPLVAGGCASDPSNTGNSSQAVSPKSGYETGTDYDPRNSPQWNTKDHKFEYP